MRVPRNGKIPSATLFRAELAGWEWGPPEDRRGNRVARIHIGISGWRYAPWRGIFYPADLAQDRELAFASRALPTIELNGSFYSLQTPASYARWYDATPAGFVFAVKGARYITHMKRLNDVEAPLANFLASGLFNLRRKLGPILWQFPPNFAYDRERFEDFMAMLPYDTDAASAVARRHDGKLRHRASIAWRSLRSGLNTHARRVLLLRQHGQGPRPDNAMALAGRCRRLIPSALRPCAWTCNKDTRGGRPAPARSWR